MNYIETMFDWIYNIMFNVYFPIPITPNFIFKINAFSFWVASVIITIMIIIIKFFIVDVFSVRHAAAERTRDAIFNATHKSNPIGFGRSHKK